MTALPRATVPLFDAAGGAAPVLREILNQFGQTPRGALVDAQGRAQPTFRQFLAGIASKPLPSQSVALADSDGRATRVFTMLLAALK